MMYMQAKLLDYIKTSNQTSHIYSHTKKKSCGSWYARTFAIQALHKLKQKIKFEYDLSVQTDYTERLCHLTKRESKTVT